MLRHDSDLHAPLLNEEDRIRDLTLNVDVLIFPIICRGPARPIFCEQLVGIIPVWPKRRLRFLHDASLYGAGAQHSQSPMTANGGAVMPPICGVLFGKTVNIVPLCDKL